MKHLLGALLVGFVLLGCAGTLGPGTAPTPTNSPLPLPTATTGVAATALPPGATVLPPAAATPVLPTRPASPTSTKPALDTPDWFNDVVLYEIFPRSFYDTNGDGIGDLKGITAKLDYLQSLGVGALWLTPIFASPSYHGYDTTDYYKINPEFGTTKDLVDLVNAAHARKIKIILDFVAGHTSDQHPFFQDAFGNPQSKYANWYRWLDDAHRSYEYFGASPDLPSLNQDNPETRQYLIDTARYWMDEAHIDGFRLDYALGVSHDFWKAFRAALKAAHPDFLLLGEVWTSGLKIVPYYDREFDATFDFPLYFDLMGSHDRAGNSPLLAKGSPAAFETTLQAETRLYNPGAQSVRFLNNHDTLRVASQLKDVEREKLAATLLLTLPSTPMLYYGQELGMPGDKSDGDKTLREPMDWYAAETGTGMTSWYKPNGRFNKAKDGISVEEQANKPESLLETYRRLIALRLETRALRDGEFVPLPANGSNKAIVFARVLDSELYVVVANVADEAVSFTLDLRRFRTGPVELTDALSHTTGSPLPAGSYPFSLPPRSAFVFRVQ